MSFLPHLPIFWLGFIAGIIFLAVWQYYVNGRLYCFRLFCGHCYAVLKEEVCRPLRVIRKALSRKPPELNEIEKSIS